MSALTELTSFLWWLMLLSSGAFIMYDIVNSLQRPKSSPTVLLSRQEDEDKDEVGSLAVRVARAVQRPTGLRMIETEAAETILGAALAAQGLSMPKGYHPQPEQVRNVLRDPQLVRFVEDHLVYAASRAQLKRGDVLAEFQYMLGTLDLAGKELT